MTKYYLFLFCFLTVLTAIGQETTSRAPSLTQQVTTENNNYLPNTWNPVIGSCELNLSRSSNQESLMSNLVCDAMLAHTEADFAFISYGELYSDIYRGEITHLDMFNLIPFNRTLVVFEMKGDTLKQIIEKTLGGNHTGLAIAGGKVEYDPNRPAKNRLTFVQVGPYPLYPKKDYRVVTTDYHANGFAGFELLKEIDPKDVFRTGTLLRDVIAEHIRQNSPLDPTKVMLDGRWTQNKP